MATERSRIEINASISARIIAFIATGGMTLPQAFDHVLGAGNYDALVEELYHDLRAKAVA